MSSSLFCHIVWLGAWLGSKLTRAGKFALHISCSHFTFPYPLACVYLNCLYPVIDMPEGRRSVMDLSHRMVKNFWAMLNMSSKLDFPHWSELNNSGVSVSVRQSNGPGQPSGMIVSAASSLWLPISCETLFNFFQDEKTRSQVNFQLQVLSSSQYQCFTLGL